MSAPFVVHVAKSKTEDLYYLGTLRRLALFYLYAITGNWGDNTELFIWWLRVWTGRRLEMASGGLEHGLV